MNDPQLTAVLDRAVEALSPRDPDPVAAVLRRVRARRRRIIATTCAAVVVVVAGAGVAGALGTGLGTRLTGPPASDSGPTRTVTDWDGPTVSVGSVAVPVPGGWRAWTPKALPQGTQCSDSRVAAADHNVYVLPAARTKPTDPLYLCDNPKAAYVTVNPEKPGIGGTGQEVQLDPSGQPVWTIYNERNHQTSLRFPWSLVSVDVYGMDRDGAEAFLAGVRADPTGRTAGVTPPSDTRSASFVDLVAPGSGELDRRTPSWGRDLDEKLVALIEGEPEELTCVPAPGTVTTASFDRGSDAPDGRNGQLGLTLTFDRSGACHQAFSPTGGLVELDGKALHDLLMAHSLNEPILGSEE